MYFMFTGRWAYKYLGGGGSLIICDSIRYFGRRAIYRQFGEIAVKRHKSALLW